MDTGTGESLKMLSFGLRQRHKVESKAQQILLTPDDEKPTKREETLPTWSAIFVLVILFLIFQTVLDINNTLPNQVKIKDEASQPHRFIGERAEKYLKGLAAIGPKVVGSHENEVVAVQYLTKIIKTIMRGANNVHNIQMDIQQPTGNYYFESKPYGMRNVYANIQNIIVRVSPRKIQSNDSVIMNCHYDTFYEAPGASDDGLNCAVMLEILTKLTQLEDPLQNNVILLFNGAEEIPLQGSHGFITQHKWANEVRVVVNVEAAGAGGREILFQTSPQYPWLLEAYAKAAVHPVASVLFEEIYHSGILPSDTDFRIFRDHGVPGFDFAHVDNGYVYHTKYDTASFIRSGVYQNTGDNLLALIKQLTSSPDLNKMATTQTVSNKKDEPVNKLIFFDVFGLAFVSYPQSKGDIWNLVCVLASIITILSAFGFFSKQFRFRAVFDAVSIQLASWGLTLVLLLIIPKILDMCDSSMSWYTNHSLLFFLYLLPVVYAGLALPVMFRSGMMSELNVYKTAGDYMLVVQLFWTVLLAAGTFFKIRTSYILMILVLCPTVGNFVISLFKNYLSDARTVMVRVCFALIPATYSMYLGLKTFIILVPMSARMNPLSNTDMLMSIASFFFGLQILGYFIPVFFIFKSPRKIIYTLLAINLVSILLVTTTPVGFPFQGNPKHPRLQRLHFVHLERTFFNELGEVRRHDSGIWGWGTDRHNTKYVSVVVPEFANAMEMSTECKRELFCAAPFYKQRQLAFADKTVWIPTSRPPFVHDPPKLVLKHNSSELTDRRRESLQMVISGSDFMTIYFSPLKHAKITKWSFVDSLEEELIKWNGRNAYYISYAHGIKSGKIDLTLDFDRPKNETGPVLEITIIAHYRHDTKFWGHEFKQFVEKFPDWTQVIPWTASLKSWVV